MNKRALQAFCLKQGWGTSYSGKDNTMYVHTHNKGHVNIEVPILQHFGLDFDFLIQEVGDE